MQNNNWHAEPRREVLRRLETSAVGLTSAAAAARQAQYGRNALPDQERRTVWRTLAGQLRSPLALILLAAVAVSLGLGSFRDAAFIAVVVAVNSLVSAAQEWKANRSFEALRKALRFYCRARRDGRVVSLPAEELVPGDIIELRAGDRVPADVRLLELSELSVNEALLTGESLPVDKQVTHVALDVGIGDRLSLAHSGTLVESGWATGVVVVTGLSTELGQIVQLLQQTRERLTPLQQRIAHMSRLLAVGILLAAALIAALGLLRGTGGVEIAVAALALAVSAIPEGLLPAVTLVLSLGMQRLLAHNALVRRLVAVEGLGGVTVICTDKTGTLTRGEMEVDAFLTAAGSGAIDQAQAADGSPALRSLLETAVLLQEAEAENPDQPLSELVVRGRPTDRALLLAGWQAGQRQADLLQDYPRLAWQRFDSQRKYAAAVHQWPAGGRRLLFLGAFEIGWERSQSVLGLDGGLIRREDQAAQSLLRQAEALAASGRRVLAVAWRELGASEPGEATGITQAAYGLTLIGFIGLRDPLRPDAQQSVAEARRAGIRSVMITGDHLATARAIASELDLPIEDGQVADGRQIDGWDDQQLQREANRRSLFARVSPAHKLRLVRAFQANGERVAMIGDGVNDAVALRAADVGVAVGSGSDVTREVADLVLLDDRFSTVVRAVEEGRLILGNIQRVAVYLLADDFTEIVLFAVALLAGFPLPLLAVQVLWVNLIEDTLPGAALAADQSRSDLLKNRSPRASGTPLLDPDWRRFTIRVFLISSAFTIAAYVWLWHATGDIGLTRTFVFTLTVLDSLLFAYSVWAFPRRLWRAGRQPGRWLHGAVALGLIGQILAVHWGPLQAMLHTVPLPWTAWALILALVFVETTLIELVKPTSVKRETGNSDCRSPRRATQ